MCKTLKRKDIDRQFLAIPILFNTIHYHSQRGGYPPLFFHSTSLFSMTCFKNNTVKTPLLCHFITPKTSLLSPVGEQNLCSTYPRLLARKPSKTPFLCHFITPKTSLLWPVGAQTLCSSYARPFTRNIRRERSAGALPLHFQYFPNTGGGGGVLTIYELPGRPHILLEEPVTTHG